MQPPDGTCDPTEFDLPDDPLASVNLSRGRDVSWCDSTAPLPPNSGSDLGTWESTSGLDLGQLIASGGFGSVFEAEQRTLGRAVAVKCVRKDLLAEAGDDEKALAQLDFVFRQEAATAAFLEHPNIVPIHDLRNDPEGHPLVVMKRLRGTPWDRLIAQTRNLPVPEFLEKHLPILASVAQAVAYAHSRGIVHRDLKPTQVMVGEFGEVVLLDWGLAMLFDADLAKAFVPGLDPERRFASGNRVTNPGGTPAFMAPEQTRSSPAGIGPWTDVYLLGGTLYFLLTLRPPHYADNTTRAFYLAAIGEVKSVESAAPDRAAPRDLIALAMRALAAEPSDRVPSAAEFLRELSDIMSGATHRRESRQLSEQVARRLQSRIDGYAALSELDAMLARAEALWPDSTEVIPLRDRLFGRIASTAISHGDLTLARVQADRIRAEAPRGELLREIERMEGARRRQRQQRVLALSAAGILIVVLIGTLFYVQEQRAESALRKADLALLTAENARQAEVARTLRDIDQLRSDEGKLAGRLAAAFPPPIDLVTETVSREGVADSGLLAEVADVRRRRSQLEEVTGGALDAPPFQLLLAEANSRLYSARTASEFSTAYDAFSKIADTLGNSPEARTGMGIAAARAGYMTSATLALEMALQDRVAATGASGPEYARVLALVADAYRLNEDSPDKWQDYYRRSLAILEPQYLDLAREIATQLSNVGEQINAVEYTSPTLAIVRRVMANRPGDLARELKSSSELLLNGDDLETAISLLGEAEQLLDPSVENLPLLRELRVDRANAMLMRGDFALGVPMLEQLIAELGTIGVVDMTLIEAQRGLAFAAANTGRYDDAQLWAERARESARGVVPELHPLNAELTKTLAVIAYQRGDYARAEQEFLRTRDHLAEVVGTEHPLYADNLNMLAVVYGSTGRFEEALSALEECLAILRARTGENSLATATAQSGLANLLTGMGRYERAAEALTQALAATIASRGERSAHTAGVLSDRAFLFQSLGRIPEAQADAERAVEIIAETVGLDSDLAMAARNRLANVLLTAKEYDSALVIFNDLLERNMRLHGGDHMDTLRALQNIGATHTLRGDPTRALPSVCESAAGYLRILGPDHQEAAVCMRNLAEVLELLGRKEEALVLDIESTMIRAERLGIETDAVRADIGALILAADGAPNLLPEDGAAVLTLAARAISSPQAWEPTPEASQGLRSITAKLRAASVPPEATDLAGLLRTYARAEGDSLHADRADLRSRALAIVASACE